MSASTFVACTECGAQCLATARTCWMCDAPLPGRERAGASGDVGGGNTFVAARPQAAEAEPPLPLATRSVDNFTLAAIVFSIVIVGVGITVEAAGLGIAYAIFVLPALIATLVKRERRKQTNRPTDWSGMIADFALSLAVTLGILVVLPIVAVVALAVYCVVMTAHR